MKTKGHNLLTVAISQTWSNDKYEVLTYELDEKKYYPMEILKENFFTEDGSAAWDLCHITSIEDVNAIKNGFYDYNGSPKIVEEYSKPEMVKFFNSRLGNAQNFFKGSSMWYGVVSVDSIIKLHEPEGPDEVNKLFRQRIDFVSGGKEFKKILNKDYRWLAYWESVPAEATVKKIEQWENYFGSSGRNIFLILKKRKFYNGGFSNWICGFHCI